MQTQYQNSLMSLVRVWITALLSLGLILSFLPVTAFAASDAEAKIEGYSNMGVSNNDESDQAYENGGTPERLSQSDCSDPSDVQRIEEKDVKAELDIAENVAVDNGSSYIEFFYIDEESGTIGADEGILATFYRKLDATEDML